jgi:hypothetical protein
MNVMMRLGIRLRHAAAFMTTNLLSVSRFWLLLPISQSALISD